MIQLGKTQTLEMVRKSDFGIYLTSLDGPDTEQVLLPKNQVPNDMQLGDEIEVFIYKDSEDRLIATTTVPALELGHIAKLKVKEVTLVGAFLDWGLAKDLLLPFKEQPEHVKAGDEVLVALYIDKSQRLCATMNIYEYLRTDSDYKKDEHVSGTVYEIHNDIGAFVAVDNCFSGLIPKQELFKPLKPGDHIEARISNVRPDGKLNLCLREKAYIQMDLDSQVLLSTIKNNNGFLPLNDKSTPEAIKTYFNFSKNAFKRAVGRLLKENYIEFKDNGITLKENK